MVLLDIAHIYAGVIPADVFKQRRQWQGVIAYMQPGAHWLKLLKVSLLTASFRARLTFTSGGQDYQITLENMRLKNFVTGERWYFQCGSCRRRCCKLLLSNGAALCRECVVFPALAWWQRIPVNADEWTSYAREQTRRGTTPVN